MIHLLASLGLQKTISELRSMTTHVKSPKRKYIKVDYSSLPLRRSNRLKQINPISPDGLISVRRSPRLPPDSSPNGNFNEKTEKMPANAPFMDARL